MDSRKIKTGYVFLAVYGLAQHGLKYAEQAMESGAALVIYDPLESEWYVNKLHSGLDNHLIAVNDLGKKAGAIADRFYQSPSRKLDVIGITGTNGKTTCSHYLSQVSPDSGVIGTLGWGVQGALHNTLNTTPDAVSIQQMLSSFSVLKKSPIFMEVSSHGLQQGRVDAVNFKGAVFTNLTRDHLDYHGSMEDYLQSKLLLFMRPELQFVVVNTDDPNSQKFLAVVNNTAQRWAFSSTGKTMDSVENVLAKDIECSLKGIQFSLCWRKERVLVRSAIIGDFNLENILVVIAVLLAQGHSLKSAVNKIAKLKPVPGRMECFGGTNEPLVIVDYAHTPDALEKLLSGLKKYCQGRLHLVFGCGGNRDKGKRSQMGLVAEKYADEMIIANDNPRLERSEQIIDDIVEELSSNKHAIIQDREQAIKSAIRKAKQQDCIVVAGKGHEDYQDINGLRQAFSDQKIVKQTLLKWTE